jgi:hypothetical protein
MSDSNVNWKECLENVGVFKNSLIKWSYLTQNNIIYIYMN